MTSVVNSTSLVRCYGEIERERPRTCRCTADSIRVAAPAKKLNSGEELCARPSANPFPPEMSAGNPEPEAIRFANTR